MKISIIFEVFEKKQNVQIYNELRDYLIKNETSNQKSLTKN